MIIVYFGGAVRGDRIMATVMGEMLQFIKDLGVSVLTEHVVAGDPIEAFAKRLGKRKEDLTAEEIEMQDIEWLDQSTHAIFEISGASTGTGREIEYAHTKKFFGKTPAVVLCLYHIDREFYASPMIRGMTPDRYPNVLVRAYINLEEAKEIIREFLTT